MDERRAFFRHPSKAPIQVFPQQKNIHMPMSDISGGGLAFKSNVFLEEGKVLKIRIPHVKPPFEASCVVRWRRKLDHDNYFEIGVMFLDEQTQFRIRMVEQVCHIMQYRQQLAEKGRHLTFEKAAKEWVDMNAANFGKC
ncbi:MAG: PilZ domain-containing protein [Mariprofundus sp.]|nr:PilZ domain-containing protein [Mariprofundus sp.]